MYNEPQTISKAQNEMSTTMSGTVTVKEFILFLSLMCWITVFIVKKLNYIHYSYIWKSLHHSFIKHSLSTYYAS